MVQVLRGPDDAVRRFGLGNDEWLRPKPKTFFHAEFILNSGSNTLVDQDTMNRMKLMVRTIDRPQFNVETETLNQYNRPRVIHSKIKYQSVRVIYYDDVKNTALKVFNEYRKFYYGDFQNKDHVNSWTYDQVAGPFEALPSQQNWGLSNNNNLDGENSYFFKNLILIEFYNDQYTVFNLIHPKITSFEMDPRDISEEAISETTITVEYEGVTHQHPLIDNDLELINAPMTPEIADRIGVPYNGRTTATATPPPRSQSRGTSGQQDLNKVADLFNSRSPQQAIESVTRGVLPPKIQNARIPTSWDDAINQASTITGNNNLRTVNKVTKTIKRIFG